VGMSATELRRKPRPCEIRVEIGLAGIVRQYIRRSGLLSEITPGFHEENTRFRVLRQARGQSATGRAATQNHEVEFALYAHLCRFSQAASPEWWSRNSSLPPFRTAPW